MSRRAEALALIRFAETTHPRGKEAKQDPNWRRLAAELEASADRAPISEFVVRASALLAWFKDGHTTLRLNMLSTGPFALDMPVRATAFYDGLYIVAAAPELSGLLGARIDRVQGVPVAEVVRRFAAIWPANNPAWTHLHSAMMFANPGLLHGLKIVGRADAAPIHLETSLGSRDLVPAKTIARQPIGRPQSTVERWSSDATATNFIRRLPERSMLYVSIDDISQPVATFLVFARELFAAMEEPGWSKLVIDLRRNGGGNNFLIEPIRKHVERSRFNRPGGLYVMTSPVTFSAAQNFVNRLERETFAIFAGEPTGGAPNHYGDARAFPGTILHGAVSTVPWFDSYPMDHRSWVMPDILIPSAFADWAAGRDKALDAVLADQTAGSGNDLSEERVFYWARKSQSASWKPFWMA